MNNKVITYLTKGYMLIVATISVVALVYVYAFPPSSMFATRYGVPHFTPKVMHPETGKPVSVNDLVRHYRGD